MSVFIDLAGKYFGDLEVICLDEERNQKEKIRQKNGEIKNAKIYWKCKCHYDDCNSITSIEGHELRNGRRTKCTLHKYNAHRNVYDIESYEYGIGWTSNTNKPFYFDLEDYDKIKNFYWRESNGYIECHRKIDGKAKSISLHRLVMGCIDSNLVVDHISGKRNDNRWRNSTMGMYDTITHKMKCPKCNKKFEFSEQVKWTNACLLYDYKVGDKIDVADGEYTYATWVRPELKVNCPKCNEEIHYKVIVKDGILTEISVI